MSPRLAVAGLLGLVAAAGGVLLAHHAGHRLLGMAFAHDVERAMRAGAR